MDDPFSNSQQRTAIQPESLAPVDPVDQQDKALLTDSPNKATTRIYFPWLSTAASLSLVGFLIISSRAELAQYYQLPSILLDQQIQLVLLVLLGVIYLIDVQFFRNRKHALTEDVDNLKSQLNSIWQSKKIQQQRANTYSGHTEKLKSFISDKLLEFIEYDEKFIHFKGIAAEVRHNGVISYDKVITALNKAIEQQHFLALYEQNENQQAACEPNSQTNTHSQPLSNFDLDAGNQLESRHTTESLANYQQAIDAMRYLWDLLDLSTADNMALHIGNQLIECEEHYYQLNLDSEKKLDATQSIPISPTFIPQMALLMTINLLADESEIRNLLTLSTINQKVLHDKFLFENEQFRIELENVAELLGNPNHIILLLENLIKNALFFSHKSRYKQNTDRIAIRLQAGNGYAHYSVYNRGPHISQQDRQQVFNLGYSTRRNKQHHGKGLGLFFASQIVKGYQGDIQFTNIETPQTQYSIILKLSNGESINHSFACEVVEGKVKLVLSDGTRQERSLNVTSKVPITSLEIFSAEDHIRHQSAKVVQNVDFEWLDPSANLRPKWLLKIKAYRSEHQLTMKLLDISGVCFDIKFPTADSFLDGQQVDFINN